MKTIVVYYSRTGTTSKVGKSIAAHLKCDVEEIIDAKNRMGPLGYLTAGKDAMQKNLTVLKKIKHDLKKYDCVIIGGPVWSWTVCPPIRTYLEENKSKLKKIAFFCTQGGSGAETAFSEMEKTCRKKPLNTVVFTTKEVNLGKSSPADFDKKIKEFCKKIK